MMVGQNRATGKVHANYTKTPDTIPRGCHVHIYQLETGPEAKLSNSMIARMLVDMYRIALPCNFELSTSRQVPDLVRK